MDLLDWDRWGRGPAGDFRQYPQERGHRHLSGPGPALPGPGCQCVYLDADGEAFLSGVQAAPDLVKANQEELGRWAWGPGGYSGSRPELMALGVKKWSSPWAAAGLCSSAGTGCSIARLKVSQSTVGQGIPWWPPWLGQERA